MQKKSQRVGVQEQAKSACPRCTNSLVVATWRLRPVSWNTPAWSLSCEMFLYLSFPLAAAFLHNAGWRKTIAIAAVACCLTRVLWAFRVPDQIKPLIHFSDFLMGIAASCAYDLLTALPRQPRGARLYLPSIRPLNALLLIGSALGGGTAARALSSRAAVHLGKASYAMYILHLPLPWGYLRWSKAVSPATYFLLVIAVSACVYSFVEEPANRYLRSRLQGPLQA